MSVTYDDLMNATVILGQPGLAGTGILEAEKLDILSRLGIVEGRRIDQLPGTAIASPAAGDVLAYNGAGDVTTARITSGTIARVYQLGTGVATNVDTLNFLGGFAVSEGSRPDMAVIDVMFGTENNTAARGDHVHALPTVTRLPIAPQGYMSSGTRPLGSVNVVLPANKTYLVKAELAPLQIRGADPGPCYYQLSLTINGNTKSTPAPGTGGYWVVQGVPKDAVFSHERTIGGTGAAITVSASIAWGGAAGGFYTDAGELVVTVTPNR